MYIKHCGYSIWITFRGNVGPTLAIPSAHFLDIDFAVIYIIRAMVFFVICITSLKKNK